MILTHYAFENLDLKSLTGLTNQLSHLQTYITLENLISIFRVTTHPSLRVYVFFTHFHLANFASLREFKYICCNININLGVSSYYFVTNTK